MTALSCPSCGAGLEVKDSRPSTWHGQPAIRRRRRCKKCQWRGSTYEVLDAGESRLPKMIAELRGLRRLIDTIIREAEQREAA